MEGQEHTEQRSTHLVQPCLFCWEEVLKYYWSWISHFHGLAHPSYSDTATLPSIVPAAYSSLCCACFLVLELVWLVQTRCKSFLFFAMPVALPPTALALSARPAVLHLEFRYCIRHAVRIASTPGPLTFVFSWRAWFATTTWGRIEVGRTT